MNSIKNACALTASLAVMSFAIAFYEIGLAYGGPEEGSWWYETGEIVRLISITRTEGAALTVIVVAVAVMIVTTVLLSRTQAANASEPTARDGASNPGSRSDR